MGIFNFGKKQEPAAKPRQDIPPVDKAVAMQQQGLDNSQIIQRLHQQGHEPKQVFDAVQQADIKSSIGQPTEPKNAEISNPMQFSPESLADTEIPPPPEIPGQMPMPETIGVPENQAAQQINENEIVERVEEIAEAIIDEKWNEIVKSINKIIDWKERVESKVAQLDQQISDLKSSFDNLSGAILGKIKSYDKNITSIGSDIKAMEKVFQKVLPELTESVHSLESITEKLRDKKKSS